MAAGSGERDTAVDCKILQADVANGGARLLAAQILPGALRPTLFLAQLSNLLAGNISIVHHVTGSSRTFMGEEMAGLSAIQNAFSRVAAGQSRRCLVGGALNAQREDLLLSYELGHNLWRGAYRPVAQRGREGGFIPGEHRRFSRDRIPRKRRGSGRRTLLQTGLGKNRPRRPGGRRAGIGVGRNAGLHGRRPARRRHLQRRQRRRARHRRRDGLYRQGQARRFAGPLWTYGDLIGHGVEAHFPAGLALAALALKSGCATSAFFEPAAEATAPRKLKNILVTGVGHWRGEGLALLQSMS